VAPGHCQKSRPIDPERSERGAGERGRGNRPIEESCAERLGIEASLEADHPGHCESRRTGENWHGEQAGTDPMRALYWPPLSMPFCRSIDRRDDVDRPQSARDGPADPAAAFDDIGMGGDGDNARRCAAVLPFLLRDLVP
jgi:hypothetical protein